MKNTTPFPITLMKRNFNMRFDNAFLTKANNLGMEFKDKGVSFFAYRNKEGQIITSEHANEQQKEQLVKMYEEKEEIYKLN